MITVSVRTYKPGQLGDPDRKTVLRYSGDPRGESGSDKALSELLDTVISGSEAVLTPKVCCAECGITVGEGKVSSEFGEIESEYLAEHLSGCSSAVFFAATAGIGTDRAVTAMSKISPARALLADALGSERAEALCDLFEREVTEELIKEGKTAVPRYSPGYGDFSLECQKQIINGLQCQKHIGLTLSSCLMMTPTKSVTGVIGIRDGTEEDDARDRCSKKCSGCGMKDCGFRDTGGTGRKGWGA